ncbi:hypothetical protein IW256_004110 [Actinomadura viridis]|uniref:DUF2470 domain-containing protein n=1 Tax=Actinomadura viridis TaxID=58110 RepID=A0A931DL02_9ACTN|nr:hypothetical protein [Actinomadura viridis]
MVRQITRHMNDDHAEDCAAICRALGGRPGAHAARMTGLDADGIDFVALMDPAGEPPGDEGQEGGSGAGSGGAGREVPVRIPWSRRLTERAQVRHEVVRMAAEARAALGPAARAGH